MEIQSVCQKKYHSHSRTSTTWFTCFAQKFTCICNSKKALKSEGNCLKQSNFYS